MTIIGSPERKNFKNPNLHNYTLKSRASRQKHFEKAGSAEWAHFALLRGPQGFVNVQQANAAEDEELQVTRTV
jgi:hypothetical protein